MSTPRKPPELLQPRGKPRRHDRIAIGKELIEWAQLPDSLNLNGFCAIKLLNPDNLIDWGKNDPEFIPLYNIAKSILANRREQKLSKGELHTKAFDLNAKVYDRILKAEEREQLEFESRLKQAETLAFTEDQKAQNEALIKSIGQAQAQAKADRSDNGHC